MDDSTIHAIAAFALLAGNITCCPLRALSEEEPRPSPDEMSDSLGCGENARVLTRILVGIFSLVRALIVLRLDDHLTSESAITAWVGLPACVAVIAWQCHRACDGCVNFHRDLSATVLRCLELLVAALPWGADNGDGP